jgi:murein DD-endopeptidase MepM/ murein hydrolase activator NlpD
MKLSDGIFALLGCALVLPCLAPGRRAAASVVPRVVVQPLPMPKITRTATLERGETLPGLLGRLGLSAPDSQSFTRAVDGYLDVRVLPVGLRGEATVDVFSAVRAVRLTADWRSSVVLERAPAGVTAHREQRPVERQLVVVAGVIESSLFRAVQDAHEDDDLALELADLFQWDIDFHREVQRGDTFSLLVERISSDGRTVAYGPIVAASYVNQGKRYQAIRFATTGATAGYYDEAARPLRKQFLRAPLRFSRVTSRFSASRLHPILGTRKPHWGVDYAAPIGTPVLATADGTVGFVGVQEGAGNKVELRHAGGFTTSYLHLSHAAAGIAPGAPVRQGQVIGFVGSTGLSTGPHLDYRITQQGRHLNPLRIGHDPTAPLPTSDLPRFMAWQHEVLPYLGSPGALAAVLEARLCSAAPCDLHG